MFNLKSGIPRSIKDPEDLNNTFKKYGIIPYYGTEETSSHTFLDLLMNLTSLSPSFIACMMDINAYTFGRNIDIVDRTVVGMCNEDVDLSFEEKNAYKDFFKSLGISLVSVIRTLKKVLRYTTDCGNAYIYIKRVQVGESVRYVLKTPHYKHCAYLVASPGDLEEDYIIMSKFLSDSNSEELMSKHPPKVLRATLFGDPIKWDQTEPGLEEAIIHIKTDDDNDEGDYYGRPAILSALTWLYTDYEIGNLNSKISATEIISKKILAFEAPDPNTIDDGTDEISPEDIQSPKIAASGSLVTTRKKEDYFERNLRVLREVTTNLGRTKVSSIGGIEYPHAGTAPTVIDLEINRDTEHHSWQMQTANAVICSVLGWSPDLTNFRQAKANIGGNTLYDTFTIQNETTIQPIQTYLEDIGNYLLNDICEREGGDQKFKDLGIKLPNVIGEMLEKFSDVRPDLSINPETQTNE